MRVRFSRWDVLPAVLCLLLAGFLLMSNYFAEDGRTVVLTDLATGQETCYDLSEEQTVTVQSGAYTLCLVIADGCVYVRESNCPDHVCEKSGKISRAGEVIVCAPAGISVRIREENGGDIDAVLG